VDGSGAPWFRGDVAIAADRIVQVGGLGRAQAETVIDAGGQVVCPGFIDIHSHSDTVLSSFGAASGKIRQGVTSEVVGQCGASAAPAGDDPLFEGGTAPDWTTTGEYLDVLRRKGTAVNVAALVGHGSVRRAVMGNADRAPTREELDAMVSQVAAAMEQGAWGISTGLIYAPGMYARTPELVATAAAAARYGGIYFTHLRNEGNRLLESIEEALVIGGEARIPVQISHLKAAGEPNWGLVQPALERLEAARCQGIDVTADQYPYIASATSLSAVLPGWVREGSREEVMGKLRSERQRITAELDRGESPTRDWSRVMVSYVGRAEDRRFEGLRISEVAAARNQEPEDAVIDLLLDNKMNVGMVRFGMSEADVKLVMRHRLVMIGSDASARSAEEGSGKPHPRAYGTFPRVLGKYVREGVLPLEEAVRKMTSLPAARMGFGDRGLLRPGMAADVVVFDPATIADRATFTDPHQYPDGVNWVIVNGEVAVTPSGQRPVRPGQVLVPGRGR
jgi:N-acyl-D-amino-acid deacylase